MHLTIVKARKSYSKIYLLFSYIFRHYEEVHPDEAEVKKFAIYCKGSKERKPYLDQLIKKGDYRHNALVVNRGWGYFIVSRRPKNKKVKHSDYAACLFCEGFFLKPLLNLHSRKRCNQRHGKTPLDPVTHKNKSKIKFMSVTSTESKGIYIYMYVVYSSPPANSQWLL